MSIAVFTIVTRNRLHLARALMQSVAKNYPEAERHVLVVDPAGGLFDPQAEPFNVTFGHELNMARFEEFAFVNDALSLCCLLKPVFALWLLARTGAQDLVYADSDMLFHARPEALPRTLVQNPVVLTPHVLSPLGSRTDADIMRSGAFNAGFFAVRRGAESLAFLTWWRERMRSQRQLDAAFCHDQQWLSLAAVYFPRIAALRDPGYNVAYWNLSERPLARTVEGVLTAGNAPVVVFHYSFFERTKPQFLAHRPPLVVRAEGDLLCSLLASYATQLDHAGANECLLWQYGYGTFTDGKPIMAAHRQYYLERMWDDTGHNGSVFAPEFTTSNSRGLKRVYALDLPLTRSVRRVRRWLRPSP